MKNILNKLAKAGFLAGFICLLFTYGSFAQRPINRIIVWDVTASMVGVTNTTPPDFGYTPDNDIDATVREGINKIINETNYDGGSFRIIPFHTQIVANRQFNNDSKGRSEAKDYINNYRIERKPTTSTNICGAWDIAMNYIDSTRKNFIYLFTDGRQNVSYGPTGINCLSDIVRKYCALTNTSEAYTFFVSLNITDNTFSSTLKYACPKNLMYVQVDSVKKYGIDISKFLIKPQQLDFIIK